MGQTRQAELAAYEEWLRERRVAPDLRVPYFARWVERFLRLRDGRPREVWHDTLEVLLEDLGNGHYKPWQVRQAADAVTLYCGQFCERMATHAAPERNAPSQRGAEGKGPEGGVSTVVGQGTRTDGAGEELTHAQMLAEMRRILRLRHYSPSTERSYLGWTGRFLRYVGRSGEYVPTTEDVQAYLSYLAVRRNVSASTQNQAFHAVLFLCRHVLMLGDLGDLGGTVRARQGRRLPVVLSPEETRAVFAELKGKHRLMLELVYGGGLRVGELVRLRVKDLDFDACTVTVRVGKGDKDRVTFLPKRVVPDLERHLGEVRALHERDLRAGAGEAPLPDALERKYVNAGREWGWQFVFPSSKLDVDDEGTVRRRHVTTAALQKAMKQAVRRSGIAKPASVHSLRHSYATALLMKGSDIRRVQDLLGHKSVETTMVYLHVLQSMAPDLESPLDEL